MSNEKTKQETEELLMKLKCLDLASRTGDLDDHGRSVQHSANTLIKASDVIYQYLKNKNQ